MEYQMKRASIFAFALVLLLCVTSMVKAQNVRPSYPVADPGFAYVDVNNDGMYNPADGDIALTGSRDLTVLTAANHGVFNTQQSVGAYVAPKYPASLIIPPSVTDLMFTVPTTIKAGLNIVIAGTVNAPSLTLLGYGSGYHPSLAPSSFSCSAGDDSWGGQSGEDCNHGCGSCISIRSLSPNMGVECDQPYYSVGKIDLTNGTINFNDQFRAEIGGDIIINGATVTGYGDLSDIMISAGGKLYGNPSTKLQSSLFSFGNLTLGATKGVNLSGASLGNVNNPSNMLIGAIGPVSITNQSDIATYGGGNITIYSLCDNVTLTNSDLIGGNITCSSGREMNVSGSVINTAGNLTFKSNHYFYSSTSGETSNADGCDKYHPDEDNSCRTECFGSGGSGNEDWCIHESKITATNLTVTVHSGNMNVKSPGSIDMSGSVITVSNGALKIRSEYGQVTLTSGSFDSSGGISVYARRDLLADSLKLAADQMISLKSKYGKVSAVSSIINPYTIGLNAVTATGISVSAGEGGVDCDMAKWMIPAFMSFISKADISATNGTFDVTNPNGTIAFTAFGGLIDVTNSNLIGTASYSPSGVTVKQ